MDNDSIPLTREEKIIELPMDEVQISKQSPQPKKQLKRPAAQEDAVRRTPSGRTLGKNAVVKDAVGMKAVGKKVVAYKDFKAALKDFGLGNFKHGFYAAAADMWEYMDCSYTELPRTTHALWRAGRAQQ